MVQYIHTHHRSLFLAHTHTHTHTHTSKADAADIDNAARRRCQCLKSVDDSYVAIINAIEELGELANTYTIISSDHGYNLGYDLTSLS